MTTLKIYETNITPERNAMVDNLDSYLATCRVGWESSNYQTQKIEIEKEFIITTPQDIYEPQPLGNYLVLKQIEKNYYYFIVGYTWTSVNSCTIQCIMDTVNTYKDSLIWSNKTQINREFRDRFIAQKDLVIDTEPGKMSFRSTGSFTRTLPFNDSRLIGATIKSLQFQRFPIRGAWNATIDDYDLNELTGTVSVSMTFEVFQVPCEFGLGFHITYDNTRMLIDNTSEGINPALYGEDKGNIYDIGDHDNWYVVYNTQYPAGTPSETDSGAIKTLLCKDTGFTAQIASSNITSTTLSPSQLEQGIYYVVDAKDLKNEYRTVKALDQNNHELLATGAYNRIDFTGDTVFDRCIGFYKEGDSIYLEEVSFESYPGAISQAKIIVSPVSSGSTLKLNGDKEFVIYKYSSRIITGYNSNTRTEVRLSPTLPVSANFEEVYINSFEEIDRTQSTLVKVIKFPYCPINYRIVNSVYKFDELVGKDVNEKLKATLLDIPTNIKFGRNLRTNIENPFLVINTNIPVNPTASDAKDIKYETKLFNSEFYSDRVVYDSFVKDFDLEKLSANTRIAKTINIDYTPSRVFNSSFMFTFPEYKTDGMDEEYYNNILVCNRNNEMPIYSSNYLNYVRNGYNYDVKAKHLGIAQSIAGGLIQTGLGAIGLGALNAATPTWNDYRPSLAAIKAADQGRTPGVITPQSNISILNQDARNAYNLAKSKYNTKMNLSIGGGLISATGTIMNTVASIVQSENAMKQKVADLKAGGMSVAGIDDIDLLEKYSDNKAKLMNYHPSVHTKNAIYDLFYYTGYKTNKKDVPNFNSRYWFNFIQCEPVFDKYQPIYDEFLEDIKTRFQAGITVYHSHNGEYDWDQEHENWENWLIQ